MVFGFKELIGMKGQQAVCEVGTEELLRKTGIKAFKA